MNIGTGKGKMRADGKIEWRAPYAGVTLVKPLLLDGSAIEPLVVVPPRTQARPGLDDVALTANWRVIGPRQAAGPAVDELGGYFVRMVIDTNGAVRGEPQVLGAPGARPEIVAKVRQMVFRPVIINGRAYAVETIIPGNLNRP